MITFNGIVFHLLPRKHFPTTALSALSRRLQKFSTCISKKKLHIL